MGSRDVVVPESQIVAGSSHPQKGVAGVAGNDLAFRPIAPRELATFLTI